MKTINVTKSFLPPQEEYQAYLNGIWERVYLTNQGPLVQELNDTLKKYLQVRNFEYVNNGTIALMIALAAYDFTDCEVITTPFSYVATVSSILWQNCKPVFVDIDPETMCMDPEKIRKKITEKTKAIMPVHVFGMPCNVHAIQAIADEYGLKVIYDGAHAFGSVYEGRSLLDYGDISTCSFHATKLYHTIEGGAVIVQDDSVNEKMQLAMRFGHNGDDHYQLGINGKCSEFHAAMGLVNFKYLDAIIAERKAITEFYDDAFCGHAQILKTPDNFERNYAYYPITLRDEAQRAAVQAALASENVFARRYFYPSLNLLPYVEYEACPISEDIASRILCMPLYPGLELDDQKRIAGVVRSIIV